MKDLATIKANNALMNTLGLHQRMKFSPGIDVLDTNENVIYTAKRIDDLHLFLTRR